MRAEGVPQPLVAALADQVQVDLAEGGQPAVRVVHGVDVVAVAHLQAVVAGRLGHDPGPQPGVVHPDQRVCPLRVAVDQDRHLVGMRAQRPDDGAVRMRVCAQHPVRVVVGPAEDAIDRALVGRAGVDRLSLLFARPQAEPYCARHVRAARGSGRWERHFSAGQPPAARARAVRNAARSSTRLKDLHPRVSRLARGHLRITEGTSGARADGGAGHPGEDHRARRRGLARLCTATGSPNVRERDRERRGRRRASRTGSTRRFRRTPGCGTAGSVARTTSRSIAESRIRSRRCSR